MDKYGNDRLNRLIDFIRKQGLIVNTKTKARGHQGFFSNGRIDISKNIPDGRIVPTLLHEFSHYIHSKMELSIAKTGGSLSVLFNNPEYMSEIFEELVNVTHFVDENSLHKKLSYHKEQIKKKIKELDIEIKKEYPQFQRSKNFKELEKLVRKTNAKYLLKYDRVKIKGWFFQCPKIISIDTIEQDFPDLKPSIIAFIRLKSYQKKQNRVSQRINKLNKYYERPTELFARFVEGVYIDEEKIKELAPKSFERFYELLNENYYGELKMLLKYAKEY